MSSQPDFANGYVHPSSPARDVTVAAAKIIHETIMHGPGYVTDLSFEELMKSKHFAAHIAFRLYQEGRLQAPDTGTASPQTPKKEAEIGNVSHETRECMVRAPHFAP